MRINEIVSTLAESSLSIVAAGGMVIAVLTVVSFFGYCGWCFDVFSHFRLQYLACLLICILLNWRSHEFKIAVWSSAALLNFIPIASLYLPAAQASAASPRLKVMSSNLESINNNNYDAAVENITAFDPDLISIQEINAAFAGEFARKLPQYKYSKLIPGEYCEGVGLLSKYPIEESSVDNIGYNFPLIGALIKTELGEIEIFVAHPLPPLDPQYWQQEKLFFDALAKKVKERKHPIIIAGDFNATNWSYFVNDLRSKSKLSDSAQGFGFQPTWPASPQLFPLSIDIDQCFFSHEFAAVIRKVGPNIHSDHKSLFVELAKSGSQ